jgi:hypothetical protein
LDAEGERRKTGERGENSEKHYEHRHSIRFSAAPPQGITAFLVVNLRQDMGDSAARCRLKQVGVSIQ